jgi:transcriptional repressor NrdR
MQIEDMVNDIEDKSAILSKGNREIECKVIGDLILEQLGIIDKVAYIRFASVYRHFENLDEFIREIKLLGGEVSGAR